MFALIQRKFFKGRDIGIFPLLQMICFQEMRKAEFNFLKRIRWATLYCISDHHSSSLRYLRIKLQFLHGSQEVHANTEPSHCVRGIVRHSNGSACNSTAPRSLQGLESSPPSVSAQTALATELSKWTPANPSVGRRARGQKGHLKTKSQSIKAGQLLHTHHLSKWWPAQTKAVCQQAHPSLGN